MTVKTKHDFSMLVKFTTSTSGHFHCQVWSFSDQNTVDLTTPAFESMQEMQH